MQNVFTWLLVDVHVRKTIGSLSNNDGYENVT